MYVHFHQAVECRMRNSRQEVLCKKPAFRNFAKFMGKRLCQSLFFNKAAGLRSETLIKKETLTQVLSYEFYKISRNNFFYRTPPVAASVECRIATPFPRSGLFQIKKRFAENCTFQVNTGLSNLSLDCIYSMIPLNIIGT